MEISWSWWHHLCTCLGGQHPSLSSGVSWPAAWLLHQTTASLVPQHFWPALALLLTWSALQKCNHGLIWSGLLFRAHLHWPPFECFWVVDANNLLSWFSAKSLKNYFLRVTDVENKLKVTRRARGRGGINWKTGVDIYTLLLLLLSRCSRVRLCATPQTAAHQAPPSLGFSRQELWSGLPFPSPVHESEKWNWSRSVVSDS